MPRVKGQPLNFFGDAKKLRTYKLTDAAHEGLEKLATNHGMSGRTEVIEAVARADGDLVAIPRHLLEVWIQESKDRTSPRYEKAQELLSELEEYL